MKITEQDLKIFKALSDSALGQGLVDYLERLTSHVCDSRSWGPEDTKEHAQRVAGIIQNLVIDKIQLQTKMKQMDPNPFQ